MGSWFSNIHIIRNDAAASLSAEQIAEFFVQKHSLEVADKDNADVVLSVLAPEDSHWLTICTDLIDGDTEALLECASELSRALKTATLAISCLDSDYLFMNLIDHPNNIDAWASCGKYPGGKAPRRSNYAAWKAYVEDPALFKKAMQTSHVFAEECLYAVEPMLSLPAAQSMCNESDCSEACRFYFKLTKREATPHPPAFGCRLREIYFRVGDIPTVVSFQNQGDASRGVAVCLTGPCVHDNQIDVTSVCLQYHDPHGEWAFLPVELKMETFSDGIDRLYGECRELRIPPAVSQQLPMKKRMDLEFQRSICIRFWLSRKETLRETDVVGDLHVILIPLQNFAGQRGLVLKHYQETK